MMFTMRARWKSAMVAILLGAAWIGWHSLLANSHRQAVAGPVQVGTSVAEARPSGVQSTSTDQARAPLAAGDFSKLGYYFLPNGAGADFYYGGALTHRHVSGSIAAADVRAGTVTLQTSQAHGMPKNIATKAYLAGLGSIHVADGNQTVTATDDTHFTFPSGSAAGAYGGGGTWKQLRLLTVTYDSAAWNVREVVLSAAINNSLPFTYLTNRWNGSSFWNFALGNGSNNGNSLNHFGIWWEDADTNPAYRGSPRLWACQAINFPQTDNRTYTGAFLTSAVSVRELRQDGTVSGYAGLWGFQDPSNPAGPGISQRCVCSSMTSIPAWFQAKYGISQKYVVGFGHDVSLVAQAGRGSIGLHALGIPDLTTAGFAPKTSYQTMPAYMGDGKDWAVPARALVVFADHGGLFANQGSLSGREDWYDEYSGPKYLPQFDRGAMLGTVYDYIDHGDRAPSEYFFAPNTANFTAGSPTVTFARPQPLAVGDFIYAQNREVVAIEKIVNPTQVTLSAKYSTTVPNANWGWATSLAKVRARGGRWGSVGLPAGVRTRWPLGGGYYRNGTWIDGAKKSGLVLVSSLPAGKIFYTFGNYYSDGSSFEIHIVDPADLGAVAKGQKQYRNVQPGSMLDITKDVLAFLDPPHVIRNGPIGAVVGSTFDEASNTFYVLVNGCNPTGHGEPGSVLLAYSVNAGAASTGPRK